MNDSTTPRARAPTQTDVTLFAKQGLVLDQFIRRYKSNYLYWAATRPQLRQRFTDLQAGRSVIDALRAMRDIDSPRLALVFDNANIDQVCAKSADDLLAIETTLHYALLEIAGKNYSDPELCLDDLKGVMIDAISAIISTIATLSQHKGIIRDDNNN